MGNTNPTENSETNKEFKKKIIIEPYVDMQKIEQIISKLEKTDLKKEIQPIVLTLGGSFNPVHKMHIEAFNVVKNHIDSEDKIVVGGFLIPSSDDYVFQKLGKEAIKLEDRCKMIDLATKDSDFINNLDWGYINSFSAAHLIGEILNKEIKPKNKLILPIKMVPICGADFALKTRGLLIIN
jgi:hypothetical protein